MDSNIDAATTSANRTKFIIGGILIVAAIVSLIITSTRVGAQYFMTVEELHSEGADVTGRYLRLSGAVVGDSIEYDLETLTLSFMVAHLPGDNKALEAEGGLAEALAAAVSDPTRPRILVEYIGPRPDLLRHEAQAIMTGQLGVDGVFYADELLLKCPTRYEEAVPEQIQG